MKSMAPSRMAWTAVWMSLRPVMTITSGELVALLREGESAAVGKVDVEEIHVVGVLRDEASRL